ncbi:MAG: guanylate kinase, partial [Pseudomonadales bacterium]
VNAALESLPNLRISVSHTTRAKRPGEQDGVNYNFVDKQTFADLIQAGDFLEHAQVFGNFYGTSESWVRETLAAGYDVILEIDWQGAAQVRKIIPETVGIFILPPSREILRERLTNLGQDGIDVIEQRMSEARDEISHYSEADDVIVNDDFQTALQELQAIILSADLSNKKDFQKHQALISELLS